MLPYIAEFLGTMLLILLGDGVVANVTLNKSGMKGAGSSRSPWPGVLPSWFPHSSSALLPALTLTPL